MNARNRVFLILAMLTIGSLISGIRLAGQEDRLAWFLIGAALLLAVEVQRARSRTRISA